LKAFGPREKGHVWKTSLKRPAAAAAKNAKEQADGVRVTSIRWLQFLLFQYCVLFLRATL
jgi:hypothetical protein